MPLPRPHQGHSGIRARCATVLIDKFGDFWQFLGPSRSFFWKMVESSFFSLLLETGVRGARAWQPRPSLQGDSNDNGGP